MSATTHESLTTRNARSVSVRVAEISERLATDEHESRHREHIRRLQAIVWDTASLARQWRALVEDIADDIESGEDVDYRTLGEIITPAAIQAAGLYQRVSAHIDEAGRSGRRIQDAADVALAICEIESIQKWVETWPTKASSRRCAARAAALSENC